MSDPENAAIRRDVLGVAAVSYFIDPALLAARVAREDKDVVTVLFPEVDSVRDGGGTSRWVLKPAMRRQFLADPAEVQRSLVLAGDASEDDTERLLRDWLAGRLHDLPARLGDEEQRPALRRVATLLLDTRWVTPPPQQAVDALTLGDMRRHFESTASPHFVGRTAELAWLAAALAQPPRLVMLEAKGGMGKSALIAQHLLTTGAFTADGALGLVIDFDDPGLSVERLDALYLELARQAAMQAPALADVEHELRAQVEEMSRYANDSEFVFESAFDDSRLHSLINYLFERLQGLGRPVRIVFDTIERARRTARELFARETGALAARVSNAPNVSLLIAGRGPFDDLHLPQAAHLALGPLDRDTARRFLMDRQIDATVCERILDAVPATPLTLRLAARAVKDGGAGLLDGQELVASVKHALIDGFLQRRILDHLGSARLADVARRALVLFGITPLRLRDVIGPMVRPPIADLDEADQLFDELAAVTDLVLVPETGERRLTLRPEVGEELLELMVAEDRDLVLEVHTRAIAVLAQPREPRDADDRQAHLEELQDLESGQKRSAVRELTLPDLRSRMSSLMASGRFADALVLVETNPVSRRDDRLLLEAARSARRLNEPARAEALAIQLAALVPEPRVAAEGLVIRAWAADCRDDPASGRAHRRSARALHDRAWEGLLEHAVILAELAVDDPVWARDLLGDVFASPGSWAALRDADRDVIRKVCSLVRTRDAIQWAAKLGAFDGTAPEGLDLAPLAEALGDEGLVVFLKASVGVAVREGSTAPEGEVVNVLETAQRRGVLSRAVESMFGNAPRPISQRTLDLLADLLDQLRGTSRHRIQIDVAARAGQFDALARTLVANVNINTISWLDMVQELGDTRVTRRAQAADVKLAVRSALTEIDRSRHGESFTTMLSDHGFEKEATMAAALFLKRDKVR